MPIGTMQIIEGLRYSMHEAVERALGDKRAELHKYVDDEISKLYAQLEVVMRQEKKRSE